MTKTKLKASIKIIETIVFSLLIIVVIAANSYGPFFIKMLPLLFLLGICGNVFFGRPVVTTIFGIITSMCVVHLKGKYGFFENVFISFNFGLSIALGEIAGDLIKKVYVYIKKFKEKKIKKHNKKEIFTYIITAVFLILVFPLVHSYTNGSIFKYYKARAKLERYISENYDTLDDFKIKDVEYILGKDTNYLFKVLYNDKVYEFRVYLNNKLDVLDGYENLEFGQNSTILKDEMKKFLSGRRINALEYEFNIKNSNLLLKYSTHSKEDVLDDLDYITTFKYLQSINKVDVIMGDDAGTSININEYKKLNTFEEKKNYLEESFAIEFLDD